MAISVWGIWRKDCAGVLPRVVVAPDVGAADRRQLAFRLAFSRHPNALREPNSRSLRTLNALIPKPHLFPLEAVTGCCEIVESERLPGCWSESSLRDVAIDQSISPQR
jgi:hypothetical protein